MKTERLHQISQQEIELNQIDCGEYILDIGGGGEGIISKLHGQKVISIDIDEDELSEAGSDALKIVMDAGNLGFFDSLFSSVTSFFTLMYIDRKDRKRVFEEVHRVLKPNGTFEIWDVTIPEPIENEEDVFVVPLKVKLPDETIETGYGVSWNGKEQDIDYYRMLAKEKGFNITESKRQNEIFYLRLKK